MLKKSSVARVLSADRFSSSAKIKYTVQADGLIRSILKLADVILRIFFLRQYHIALLTNLPVIYFVTSGAAGVVG